MVSISLAKKEYQFEALARVGGERKTGEISLIGRKNEANNKL